MEAQRGKTTCLRSRSKHQRSRAFNAAQHFPNYTWVWKRYFESRLVNGRMCSNDKGLMGCDSFLIYWNKSLFASRAQQLTGPSRVGNHSKP